MISIPLHLGPYLPQSSPRCDNVVTVRYSVLDIAGARRPVGLLPAHT